MLGFNFRLIDEHDGNAVIHCVDATALRAFQALGILPILEYLLAGRANQDFQ